MAVPRLKHSPRFGQRASSQTVLSAPSRSSTRSGRALPRERAALPRAHSGEACREEAKVVVHLNYCLMMIRLELVVAQALLHRLRVDAVAIDADADREEPAACPAGATEKAGKPRPFRLFTTTSALASVLERARPVPRTP